MSTEHQQYSTHNQADKIQEYADRRNIQIVRTYADEGKSGLSIDGRASLQRLIADVETGNTDFNLILVYDVSRWGRFQDADESAYYEYKRLIEKRLEHGPASPNRDQIKPPTSSYSLVRTYQREVERQRKMVLKAEHAHQRLLLVVQGLKKLFADEHFVNLLRAEGLDTLPKYLAERINTLGSVSTPDHPEPEGATL